MRGVILAGGIGSRLKPLTNVLNKHLLHIARYPMIYHPIHTMKIGGINDLIIISGKEHIGTLISQLGSGKDFEMNFTYKVQDEPNGIAGALSLCEHFLSEEKFFPVILGDNIYKDQFNFYKIIVNDVPKCRLFIKEVDEPNRFGVAKINKQSIEYIIEKPTDFVSNYAVTGLYMYDKAIWNIIHDLKPSKRNELEITDINNWYIKNGTAFYEIVNGFWSDAGTFESIAVASQHMSKVTYEEFET
jgi:glucose-1-phosphate thymidylyltransferase